MTSFVLMSCSKTGLISLGANELSFYLKVRARGKLYTGDLVAVARITCKEDILNAMEKLTNLYVCVGLEDAPCCGAGFLVSRPKPGKCSACSKANQTKLKAERRALQQKSALPGQLRALKRKLSKNQQEVSGTPREKGERRQLVPALYADWWDA